MLSLSAMSSTAQEDLLAELEVFSFGQNRYAELGYKATESTGKPTPIADIKQIIHETGKKVIDLAAGNETTLMLLDDGKLFVCGYNSSGQCGLGHCDKVPALEQVEKLEGKQIRSIHGQNGCEHFFAIAENGSAYTFGNNSRGQLGLGHTENVCHPTIISSLLSYKVTMIACSYYHTVLTTSEHEVFAFGRNDYGQLGVGDSIDRRIPAKVALLASILESQLENVQNNDGPDSEAGVEAEVEAPNPSAVVPGDNHQRQECGKLYPVLSIACGFFHSVFSVADVGVLVCGKNGFGQLGLATYTDAQFNVSSMAHTPVRVTSPLDMYTEDFHVKQVSCGYFHTIAVTNTGAVYTFGFNDYGQLGLNDRKTKFWPHRVEKLSAFNIISVQSGAFHSLFLTDSGQVFATGRNNCGQLGCSTTSTDGIPDVVLSPVADRKSVV